MSAERTIALVGCTKSKNDHQMPAKELFSKSQLFQLTRLYIEKKGYDAWFIASTLHGLLDPDTIIEPYDYVLTAKERDQWAQGIATDLQTFLSLKGWDPENVRIDLFINYPSAQALVVALRDVFGDAIKIDRPYAGRGRIGAIQGWLLEEVEAR